MRGKRLSHIVFAAFAILLLGSVSAFAQKAPPPVQTPLSPTKIPQFAQPLDVLGAGIPLAMGTAIDVSICEFMTNALPPNTPWVGGVKDPITRIIPPPATWVWGYQVGDTCAQNFDANNNNAPIVQPRSYLGPAVIAARHTPTAMTFWNKLPDANVSNVKAYTTSTDQTLIWGDPLSLNTAAVLAPWTRIDGTLEWAGYPLAPVNPETNECWLEAQFFNPLAVPPPAMPAACNNNYGFLQWPQLAPPAVTPSYDAPVPAAVHIHGGEVPSVLDGGPDSWWTKNGIYGHGYYTFQGGDNIGIDAALGKATYRYPNGQEAAPVWFHDHMLGATRLNVYAGIAGAYVITEPASTLAKGLHPLGLADKNWVPPAGFKPSPPAAANTPYTWDDRPYTDLTIPLIIQDRMFDTTGQLYFPNVGINPEHPIWIPEFVGDVIVVNGKAWPFLNVQPKRYKFLFLNGSNARAYEMYLMSKTTGFKGPSMYVVGNDQGYLDTPQLINPNVKPGVLAMMPGERYEVIVDFSTVPNQTIEMRNIARTPYVGGAPVNGNTTGKIIQFRVAAVPVADTSFDPAAAGAYIRANCDLATGECVPHPMVRLTTPLGTTPANIPGTPTPVTIHKTRRLTLNEVIGPGGPLEVLVNNTLYDGTDPKAFPPPLDPRTPPRTDFTPITSMWNTSYYSELPHEGETELWEIVNLTADAHPMHPHLVAFQVLNRQPLDVLAYTAFYNAAYQAAGLPIDGAGPPYNYNNSDPALPPANPNPLCSTTAPPRYDPLVPSLADNYVGLNPTCVLGGNPDPVLVGAAIPGTEVPPMAQEIGWKDTVQALPNMITRILVRFGKPDQPANTPSTDPALAYDFSPNGGHGYVWHCHIVDHEDNEMMRPFTVRANYVAVCDPAITDPADPNFCQVADPRQARSFVMGVNY